MLGHAAPQEARTSCAPPACFASFPAPIGWRNWTADQRFGAGPPIRIGRRYRRKWPVSRSADPGTLNLVASEQNQESGGELSGGGRFSVRVLPGRRVVEKMGPAAPLARESAALRRLAGRDVAPDLVSLRRGVLRSSFLVGAPRELHALGEANLRALGSALRRTHDTRRQATGCLPTWARPARSLQGYLRLRAADAVALAGPRRRKRAERLVAGLPSRAAAGGERPFRMLHGDLVAENIVWTPSGPRLVDWEFWRMGDPAEDLAYLVELSRLSAGSVAALLEGYGVDGMGSRIEVWRPLVALDAGAWYIREGRGAEGAALLARADELSARAG